MCTFKHPLVFVSKLTNDRFYFLSVPRVQRMGSLYLSVYKVISSLLPYWLSQARNQLVPCSDHPLGQTVLEVCVCVHFLEEVDGTVFESRAPRVCPRAIVQVIYFSSFLQSSICWKTFAPLLMQPRVTKIHNNKKNKTEAGLEVILPKQDFFLLQIVQTNSFLSQDAINHSDEFSMSLALSLMHTALSSPQGALLCSLSCLFTKW